MIERRTGDLLQSGADALVNPVNCEGVMGRGLALQFRRAHPGNFRAYRAACERGLVVPGRVLVVATGLLLPPSLVINFPTKRRWRERSRMEDVEAGLDDLARVLAERRVTSVAVPPLGCGLGGLEWSAVEAAVERRLSRLVGVRILLYGPGFDGSRVGGGRGRSRRGCKQSPGRMRSGVGADRESKIGRARTRQGQHGSEERKLGDWLRQIIDIGTIQFDSSTRLM